VNQHLRVCGHEQHPGAPPSSAPVATQPSTNLDPLAPFFTDSGMISTSEDAIGPNDNSNPSDVLKVHKNASATVQRVFLFAASTGFSGYVPANGDISLDGTPINWDSASTSSDHRSGRPRLPRDDYRRVNRAVVGHGDRLPVSARSGHRRDVAGVGVKQPPVGGVRTIALIISTSLG
jgi:hypothetical protein